jgi:hypothetical protein
MLLCNNNRPHMLWQIRVERTAESDLVVFSEDVFLSLADIAAAEGAGLLHSQQDPKRPASGTQRPQSQQSQHRKGRPSKSRVAPSVGAFPGGLECAC